MKGWQFTKTNEPLELIEKEDPKAQAGYVVIDTEAVGICHSDVGVLEDEGWMSLLDVPVIMGHENAGTISEVGEGVEDFEVGERVAICPTGPSGKAPGYAYDGGFGTKMHAPVSDLVKVPDALSFKEAASATDAGMTSYHAIFSRGNAQPGMKIGLVGIGGLGQFGLQALLAEGFEDVYAVDVNESARELAKDLGAKEVVSNVKELKDKNLDLIVDFAGAGDTVKDSVETVGFKGTVVLVGMASLEATVNVTDFITGSKKLIASNGGTPEDIADIYELMATDKLAPTLTEITFDEIPEGIEQLKHGGVRGRLVAIYDEN